MGNKSYELLKILLGSTQRIKQNLFNTYKYNILDSIESLPDLVFELHLNCKSSFIPFVGFFTPSGIYKVFLLKSCSCIRKEVQ